MSEISVIGGITADIEGSAYGKLLYADSNPGDISISYGGTGRNIAENLARLGADIALISAAGNDVAGRGAKRELADLGVNVDKIHLQESENTAMILSILNMVGDMEVAMSNMDVLEQISEDLIDDAMPILKKSKIIGVDANLTAELLDYITKKCEDIPLFLDPVSVTNAERARGIIGRFHTIKPNRMEAEVLSGMEILTEEKLLSAGEWFLKQGVKRVFISMGAGGVYYREGSEEGILRPGPVNIISADGAGDAFSAVILYGFVKGLSVRETAEYGMAVSAFSTEAKTAVNPKMNLTEVKRRMANAIKKA